MRTPELWTHLHLDWPAYVINLFLEKSGTRKIAVHFTMFAVTPGWSGKWPYDALLETENSERVETLDISFCQPDMGFLLNIFRHTFSRLRLISLQYEDLDGEPELPLPPSTTRSWISRNVRPPRESFRTFPELTYLEIEGGMWSHSTIFELLNLTPGLEDLNIYLSNEDRAAIFGRPALARESMAPVHLPSLKKLRLQSWNHAEMSLLLEFIEAPYLSDVDIGCEDCRNSGLTH
ncbi:hypothetical protein SISSUDRAFT_1121925 [Sistotremastrum suecicum HHB10207 ss-3]|uniref:Uncharacterized protein n=1 Tax=Sistotremastrum suecicum HHB10207 ss-3 TaxID=1314776 RepID=A0A166A4G4_9AGAM|nr:hypothetical protein SISSUDRAFT_1121925 [Sistotremastrum suecicum HHB10207 ss-3]